MTLNDEKYEALRTAGYVGSIDDMFKQHMELAVGRAESERTYWLSLYPTGVGSLNDIKDDYFGSLGYTGALNDKERQYWTNVVL